MIPGIDATSNPASATVGEKKDISQNGLSNNINDFLKLLTTQLKNQDPTAPTDTNEFTNQLIGFSGVEQQLNTNTKLDSLLKTQETTAVSAQMSSAVNYIGKEVEVEGDVLTIQSGVQPRFAYDIGKDVRQSIITIRDSKGNVIGSFQGKTTEGKQYVNWDGKDVDGKFLPAGKYAITVATSKSDGTSENAKTYIMGEVTGVQMDSGNAAVVVDDDYVVPTNKIQSVGTKTAA